MLWVIIISFITMVAEIITGTISGSMALLADGWHMGSHVAALFLSYLVYRLARSQKFNAHFTFGSAKLYSLGGYTSAIGLTMIALFMGYESIIRFMSPVTIEFNEALLVCVIGLVVNLASAWILNDHHHDDGHHHEHEHHHDDDHHDHNHQSALAHVLADALTSVTAIIALLIGKFYGIVWVDPLIGVLGALVILKWSFSLIRNTAHELLDGKVKITESHQLKKLLEQDGGKVVDLHVWSVGNRKIAAIASVETTELKGAQSYHARIEPEFEFAHLVVEEIKKP